MGLRGGLYYLQLMLPAVGSFRSPWRILVITQFSVAILAAIAFAHLVDLVRSGRKVPWRHLVLPWLAAEVALLLTVWYDAQGDYDLCRALLSVPGTVADWRRGRRRDAGRPRTPHRPVPPGPRDGHRFWHL